MIRRLRITWRRARRTGRDLDLVAYVAGIVGATAFLVAMTGVLGPTLDAAPQAVATTTHSANAASAAHAPY
ncbi:hypothetical protein AVE30378_02522 [Achromobacter veterisilvae]|uniref:Uncharacterized protein n=1 Tax=Achromobacter veterisilvae TaxID=2069367 RepID=A0A446CH99_9BURK|nr:hypothetical protein [Achromobacter veterisilvae]SSW67242.1 hypothetical protein AVE30378_02522 [Achromobacter veterisilvae]